MHTTNHPMPKTQFPSEAEKRHLDSLSRLQRLYDGDHAKIYGIKDYFIDDAKTERKLYITTNLPALITDYFADMQIGEGLNYVVEGDAQETLDEIVEDNMLDEVLYDIAQDQSRLGYGVLRVRTGEGEGEETDVIFEDVDPSEYFPEYDARDRRKKNPIKVTLVSWITDPMGKYKNGLMYKTVYTRIDKVVTVHYEISESKADKTEGVPLNNVPEYVSAYPEIGEAAITLEETERIPVWEITNLKGRTNPKGKSDYKDIDSLIQEINDRMTHVSVQLIKHLNAKLAVATGTFTDEEGDTSITKVHEIDFIEVGEGEQAPTYVNNANSMLDSAFKYTDKVMLTALGIAKVPPELLNLEGISGGNEKVEAMRIRLFPSMRKVHRKQVAMRYAVEQALAYALAVKGKEDQKVRVEYDDVLPKDMTQVVNQMVARKAAELVSTETAIREMDDISKDEAMNEIERIRSEAPEIEPFEALPEA